LNSAKESYSEGNLELARSRTDFVIAKSPESVSRSAYLANNRLPSPNYPPPPLPEEGAALHLFASSPFPNGRSGVELTSAYDRATTTTACHLMKRPGIETSRAAESIGAYDESPAYRSTTVPYANLPNGLVSKRQHATEAHSSLRNRRQTCASDIRLVTNTPSRDFTASAAFGYCFCAAGLLAFVW
jgi:hypothetical protein